MFSEDADTDMFAATPVAGRAGAAQVNKPRALADNFDDAEGYYNFQASILYALGIGCKVGAALLLRCNAADGVLLQTAVCLQSSRKHTPAMQRPHWALQPNEVVFLIDCFTGAVSLLSR